MKAEIINGKLEITPENDSENYAIEKWVENHINGCSYIMKPLDLRTDITFTPIKPYGLGIMEVIKDKELLSNQKILLLNILFKLPLSHAENIINNAK
jgi:hypothetical protein